MAARAAGHVGFQHHDASADAEACAAIVVHAAASVMSALDLATHTRINVEGTRLLLDAAETEENAS